MLIQLHLFTEQLSRYFLITPQNKYAIGPINVVL